MDNAPTHDEKSIGIVRFRRRTVGAVITCNHAETAWAHAHTHDAKSMGMVRSTRRTVGAVIT